MSSPRGCGGSQSFGRQHLKSHQHPESPHVASRHAGPPAKSLDQTRSARRSLLHYIRRRQSTIVGITRAIPLPGNKYIDTSVPPTVPTCQNPTHLPFGSDDHEINTPGATISKQPPFLAW